ncbi:MAG TPA: hypothetical protein G4O00_10865 [Thermoflexia bacterium]|nr:hypothetical protein [Thermoflexia bacterium]
MGRSLLVSILILVGLLHPLPVAAAPRAGIQVLDQSAESHFPDQFVFRLRARSSGGEITSATLYLQVGWEKATRLIPVEPFSPAPEVEITAVWRTSGETVPPFIEVAYRWEVVDSTGEKLTTEPVYTEYTDATHDWQRLEDEHVIVFWYGRSADFGQALFQAAQEAYDHVSRITGTTTERPIRVVIYNDQDDFCVFYAPRTCEAWVGGQTFAGITVQWGSDLDWFVYDVIPHELAHVFYGEIFRNTWVTIPTWFNEGIAVYNERTDHSQEMEMVREAAEQGELKSLPVMTRGGGVVHGEVGLWYAVAYSLVAFIADTYGEETLGELILTLADNVPFEEALQQTTGLDMVRLEIEWREWLGYPVESVPTPITLPTMAVTPFALPTAPRGKPAATATPHPSPTPTVAPTTTPEETPSGGGLCPGVVGLVLPVGGWAGWSLARRRK